MDFLNEMHSLEFTNNDEIFDHRGVRANKTMEVQQRLSGNPFFEPADSENRNGIWMGRRIIGRDSEINGGVYLGGGPREAIVVDDEKQRGLNKVYSKLTSKIMARGGNYKKEALDCVFELVGETLKYSEQGVELIHKMAGNKPDQKISLDTYIQFKVGVCRHQALLCAYLLERLIKEGHLSGKVSVDRNQIDGIGGHAWARYTTKDGEIIILDVAQDYLGYLKDISTGDHRWFYERPEDKPMVKKTSLHH